MATFKEYWHTWLWRDAVSRLITINCMVWLIVAVVSFFAPHSTALLMLLALPGSLHGFLTVPWTLLTYMFTQADFLHLLCNMLWLLLFGQIFMQSQSGGRLAALYVYGGLVGGITFLMLNKVMPGSYNMIMGASCAVLAVVGAAAILFPRWEVNLLIFGPVKIIWLAVAAVIFFVVLSAGVDQSVAHGMGFLTGVAYAALKKRGIDVTRPVVNVADRLATRSVRKAYSYSTYKSSLSDEEELDRLLSKVSRSGYSALSAQERQRLFNLSQKIKR